LERRKMRRTRGRKKEQKESKNKKYIKRNKLKKDCTEETKILLDRNEAEKI
jgi:hypothetical protein